MLAHRRNRVYYPKIDTTSYINIKLFLTLFSVIFPYTKDYRIVILLSLFTEN